MKSRFARAAVFSVAASFTACAPRAVPTPSTQAATPVSAPLPPPEDTFVTIPQLAVQCGDILGPGGTTTDPLFFNRARAEFQAEKDMVIVYIDDPEGPLKRGGPACGFMAVDSKINARTGDIVEFTTRPDRDLLVMCAPEGGGDAQLFTAKGQLRIEPRDGQTGDKILSDVQGSFAELAAGTACMMGPFSEERKKPQMEVRLRRAPSVKG